MLHKQSLKATLKNIQQKLNFGNKNQGLTQEQLNKRWNDKHIGLWSKCIDPKRKPYQRVYDLCKMVILCLKTNTKMEIILEHNESSPIQLQFIIQAIQNIRDLNYDPKICVYEMVKQYASENNGYYNEQGKWKRYRFAEDRQTAKIKYEDLKDKTLYKSCNGWEVSETGEFINKFYKAHLVKRKKVS